MRKYLAEFLYQISPLLVIGAMIWGVWWYFIIVILSNDIPDFNSYDIAEIMDKKINVKGIKIKYGGIHGANQGSLFDELCYHPAMCKISAVIVNEDILQKPEQLWTLAKVAQRPCMYGDIGLHLCDLSGSRAPQYIVITVEKNRTKFMRLVVASKDFTNQ